MTIEEIAELCHEANRSYCRLIGDNSQTSWIEAPQWQKDSAVNGVRFHVDNPGSPPSRSHEEWLKEKKENGWKHGPVKDVEKKEPPCCVPYADLPVKEKLKDTLFTAIVSTFAVLLTS